MHPNHVISTILKHDSKQTSYKIALLRAINDVVLSYPDLGREHKDVAVPLRLLAEYWLAYYWPFANPNTPILQGARARSGSELRNDIAFRPELTQLRREWEAQFGASRASDGFVLIHELRVPRKRATYPAGFLKTYDDALRKIAFSIRQPIQYAGPGEWGVFERPQHLGKLGSTVAPVPGTDSREPCLVITADLWQTFREMSLWVEALCIHEWSLFTEGVQQANGTLPRGDAYTILTERPDNRRPLSWERNNIDLLMMEGQHFSCPWTEKDLKLGAYDLDHLVPVLVYPVNELWNLIPADPYFNSHVKRARLPGPERLEAAKPYLSNAYSNYNASEPLAEALRQDVAVRFSRFQIAQATPLLVTEAVVDLIKVITDSRNLATF